MPEPEEAQRLIEEHIATLGEQKAQLERALAHLNGSSGGAAGPRPRPGAEPGKVGRPRRPATPAAVNAPRGEHAAAK